MIMDLIARIPTSRPNPTNPSPRDSATLTFVILNPVVDAQIPSPHPYRPQRHPTPQCEDPAAPSPSLKTPQARQKGPTHVEGAALVASFDWPTLYAYRSWPGASAWLAVGRNELLNVIFDVEVAEVMTLTRLGRDQPCEVAKFVWYAGYGRMLCLGDEYMGFGTTNEMDLLTCLALGEFEEDNHALESGLLWEKRRNSHFGL
ncbi:hypothetical protein L484_026801 [Morus notabilis]|uniref:Uncharacterized protein n=1 Tax=Morus notabilis TaxID=981085 RepID=W9SDB7_9ROSA|nr:hypothetical protein L484_026801 [Morus notabilis]